MFFLRKLIGLRLDGMNITKKDSVSIYSRNHFYWLDIFRGLAALSVLIWHYQHFYSPYAGAEAITERSIQPFYSVFRIFYNYGGSAVQFFWVISGFVFAATYFDRTVPTWKKFFINRISRLYPLHLITLIAVALLQFACLKVIGRYQIYGFNDVYHFFLNLLLIPYWGFQKGYSFNAPIWSVSVEILTYIAFFLFLPLLHRKLLRVLFPLIGIFFILVITKSKIVVFWKCGLFFFLGCFVYLLWKKFSYLPKTLLAASVFSIVTALALGETVPRFVDSNWQHAILFPSLVMLTSVLDGFDKLSIGPRGKILGDLSFGIYLWHVPVQLVLILWLEYCERPRITANGPMFFVFFGVSTLLISYVSYTLFELRMRKAIREKFG